MKQKSKKEKKNRDRKEQRDDASFNKRVRVKWFFCTFKIGFLQLICKDSLVFKSNLKVALSTLSITFKKKIYTSQSMLRWGVDVWKYETAILFDMFLNASVKNEDRFCQYTITGTSKL